MHILRDKVTGTIKLHQRLYVTDVVKRFGMENANPVSTPMEVSVNLFNDSESEPLEPAVPYREAVGALMYAAVTTRLDIANAVSKVARYVSAPRRSHWIAVKRIIAYLKGTVEHGLTFARSGDGLILKGFCDADYAADIDTRRSTTGYVLLVNGTPVSWKSSLQSSVSLSTCVAELFTITEAVKQIMWVRDILHVLGYTQDQPTLLFNDNQAALAVCANPVLNQRVKCVAVRVAFVREQVEEQVVVLKFVPSKENLADCLTKALATVSFRSAIVQLLI